MRLWLCFLALQVNCGKHNNYCTFICMFQEDGLLLYKAYINDFPAIINCMNKWFAQSPQFCDVMQVLLKILIFV